MAALLGNIVKVAFRAASVQTSLYGTRCFFIIAVW